MSGKLPELMVTDIDGVWTDGGMYYDQTGNEWKKFNTADSAGIIYCRMLQIPTAIVTGETTQIVERRAQKLKVDHIYQGVRNKKEVLYELCHEYDIQMKDVAYIGDDLIDIPVLTEVGWSGMPANAFEDLHQYARIITHRKGGEGAFREFVERILKDAGVFNRVMQEFLNR